MFSDAAKPVQGAAYFTSVTCQPYQTCIDLQSIVHDLWTYFLLNEAHFKNILKILSLCYFEL